MRNREQYVKTGMSRTEGTSRTEGMSRRESLRTCATLAVGLYVAPSVVMLAESGCGALSFSVSQPIPEQKIMGNILAGVLGAFLPSPFALQINLDQETKARGTGPADSAGLTGLSFQLTNIPNPPRSTDNFDFVDRIELFVESTKSGTTLTKQKVADLLSVPKGATKLTLTCYPEVDLVPYIKEGSRISSTAAGRLPANDTTFDGLVTILIRV